MSKKNDVGFQIRTLSNLIKRYIDNSPEKQRIDNLTGMHGWVIGFLAENEGKEIFQRDLEEKFNIRRSTATAILQLMEKNGFITREAVPQDARLKKIVLTQKAREVHEQVAKEIRGLEAQLSSGLTAEEIEAFLATIEKIKNNLEQ